MLVQEYKATLLHWAAGAAHTTTPTSASSSSSSSSGSGNSAVKGNSAANSLKVSGGRNLRLLHRLLTKHPEIAPNARYVHAIVQLYPTP
jgi:hypothetical protein